jgi:8-oxo-dGTP pyrophosphatase MutT (NUDIX family)
VRGPVAGDAGTVGVVQSGGESSVLGWVRRSVAERVPVDERERVSVERFLVEFDRLASPLEEEADPVHVTSSAIVVGPRGVVLHRHKRLGLWLQPGGHIDPGEHPAAAALREAREETGLEVALVHGEVVHVDVHPGPRGHTHLDLRFLVDGGDADPSPPEGESPDVAWFTWDEAIALADDGLRGALLALRPA